MSIKRKVGMYKTCIRPVITFGEKTKADTTEIKKMLSTTEMSVLQGITGNIFSDQRKIKNIRNLRRKM